LASFRRETRKIAGNSPPQVRRGRGAQRRRSRSTTGVVTCWNPAAGVVFPQLFEPPPPRSVAAASPPCPRRGVSRQKLARALKAKQGRLEPLGQEIGSA